MLWNVFGGKYTNFSLNQLNQPHTKNKAADNSAAALNLFLMQRILNHPSYCGRIPLPSILGGDVFSDEMLGNPCL